MKTSGKITRIIALMLLIAMSASTLFGCNLPNIDPDPPVVDPDPPVHTHAYGEWVIVKEATETENGLKERTCECGEKEQQTIEPTVHIHAYGEWVIVKDATTTEAGLMERTCECGEKEQQTIEPSGKEYSVTYRNIKTADYPAPNGYNSADGLLTLPEVSADGYKFVGWYTASIGGELVDYIPKGNKGDVILFAHWELIEYEITYRDVPDVTNVTTYTIETSLKLTTPKWSGLEFSYWSDENGNKYYPDGNITLLPKQTFGDLVLTANWKVLRNIATPSTPDKDENLISAYSGDNGYVYMIFELGTIEHVVLDNILPDMYYKYEGMPINLHLSQTISIGEETAQSVAKTVSRSVSNTTSFSYATTWAHENSYSQNGSVSSTVGATIGNKDIAQISASVEAKQGYESSDSSSWGSTTGRDSSSSSSSGTSESVSNSIAYKKDLTSTFSEDITVSAELPSGYYAYVHAANIIVFGIVTYDVKTGNYYINTYSRLDNMHSMMMYYANVNQLNNPSVEGLEFNLPKEKIENYINNLYYVNYDANGGEGTMETTLHTVDGAEHLAVNKFTKPGHLFAGWELTTKDGVKIFLDGQSVTNLGSAKEVVTLKALWTADTIADPTPITTTNTGWVSKSSSTNPGLKYSAVIECRNRTATTVEVRITWTATIVKGGYDRYGQYFKFSSGSASSGNIKVVSFDKWKNSASSDRSETASSAWITVPVSSASATSVDLSVYYWQTNSKGTDMYKYDGTPCVKATWTVDIPAYQ